VTLFFSAVNRILRRNMKAIAKSRGLTEEQVIQKAARYLGSMSEQWRAGEAPTIAYEDPICRWAYMFAHVSVQANLFQRVIAECERHSESFRQKLNEEVLSMTIFGGGPGTELLGLAKHYLTRLDDEEHEQIDIRVDVIDRVSAWSENVSLIKDEISDAYSKKFGRKRNWPALFDIHAFTLEFSDLDGFGNLATVFTRHIFVLNFVVSEVFDLDELLPVMEMMVAGCPVGAHFVFVDRSDDQTINKIAKLIGKLKLEVESANTTKDSMDTDEEKDELSELSASLQRQPRITWNAVWVLAVKS